MSTTSEQLASVRAMIAAVESGAQEVRNANGSMVRYPDLPVLYAREKELIARLASEGRVGGRISISLGAGA